MRRIFSQIFSKTYVTKSTPASGVPRVRRLVKQQQPTTSVTTSSRSNSSHGTTPTPTTTTATPNSRSISMSSSPGSIPASASSPSTQGKLNLGPLLSSSGGYPVPKFRPRVEIEIEIAPVPEIERDDVPLPLEQERVRRSDYASLLESSVQLILSRAGNLVGLPRDRSTLISELNVKQVLSKNEEMKKVIFKVAAMALAQNEEVGGVGALHPFIITAGEVFFGGSYNEIGLGESTDSIQDILTPGLVILLLHTLFTGDGHKLGATLPNKHLLLAKALVQTSAGYLLHRTVQETNHLLEDSPENSRHFERMHQGNKLATLTGDLLVVSLIKNVACTGNNQVLELVMNSLSEFSTTEIAKRKPFESTTSNPQACRAMMPKVLAESIVFSKGFQSCLMLSSGHQPDPEVLEAAGDLGNVVGLLWKTHFDWNKLTSLGKRVDNVEELNDYLSELKRTADGILQGGKFIPYNHPVAGMMEDLITFWTLPKSNIVQCTE